MRLPSALLDPQAIAAFADDARKAVYDVIALRRDIRHFRSDLEVAPAVVDRILAAAHLAPSVGFSQPWGFIVVRDRDARARVRTSFLRCREAEAVRFPPERREAYLAHKLEGILESSLNLCVAVDLRDRGEAILGTTVQPEAVRAIACCAVQNLWLAARAEGIGVGWVSIVEPAVLRREFALPAGVEPIAYLCLGHPVAFRERPMLEETGWHSRRPLAQVVHPNGQWRDETPSSPSVPPSLASPAAPENESPPLRPPRPAGEVLRCIEPPDERARAAARDHLTSRTKPAGSLGRLEDLAVWYAGVHGVFPPPRLDRVTLALFAADHGVVVEGISAYGSQLTAAMVANVMAGGAAINALAREAQLEIVLTDVGVAGDLRSVPTKPLVELSRRRVRAGTANLRSQPAMLRAEAEAAMAVGTRVAREAAERGASAIALGEIGIGNTTSAAALLCAIAGHDPDDVVGRGTGVSDAVWARKVETVRDALARHRPDPADPLGALAVVGGVGIAALAGCALEAARLRVPVVLDGFVTNVAALVAARLDPALPHYLLAAHASPEPGAAVALRALALVPLLDMKMRLGEGTGAALAVGILRAAVHTQLSMAGFATAGIVGRAGFEEPRP